jgi:hypothetical protein
MATALDLQTFVSSDLRAEVRTDMVRIVEYTAFPRRVSNSELRVGFTRDVSDSGVCLGVDHPEPVGSMLRLGIRTLDGGHTDARIGRVAWTSDGGDGRHWIGIEMLTGTSNAVATAPFARLRAASTGPDRRSN